MVVSVEPALGLFFRINTKPNWQKSVLIKKVFNIWLEHDSFLECGQPLILDDYIVDMSVRSRGIIGCLDAHLVKQILLAMAEDEKVSIEDFEAVAAALKPLIPNPRTAKNP